MHRPTVVAFLFCAAGFGQPVKGPAFEIASVKVAEPGFERGITAGPASLTMINMPVLQCIGYAYGVQPFQVVGGTELKPTFLTINAKAAGPVKEAELKLMLQTLLAERMKRRVHREEKETNTYVLTIAKNGHKLNQVDAPGSPSFSTGKGILTGKGATIAQLTQFLSKELREPIIDQTGLTGFYDYFLDINPYMTEEIRNGGGLGNERANIVATALQAQLGLKVDTKKARVEMIVVDHVAPAPVEN